MRLTMPLRVAAMATCGVPSLSCVPGAEPAPPVVVEVTATYDAEAGRHLFSSDVEAVPAGWTTVRLINASPDVHFLLLERLPEGKTAEHSATAVVPVFQQAMDLINQGSVEEGYARLDDLPEWFGDVRFVGGPGLVSPGRTAEVTVRLEPGEYVMECYVKTADGTFHSALGMIRGLSVTDERSATTTPVAPGLEMELTNAGFGVRGEVRPGTHTVAVTFAEEDPPLLGNDVHVVRLEAGAQVEEVARWMDWSQPDGLVSDSEHAMPFEFLGGTHEMPMGTKAYFRVDLTPGKYAWVSERPASEPLYERFTVPARWQGPE